MRNFVRLILAVVSFAIIGLGITIFVINTDKGQSFVTSFIEKLLAENLGQNAKIVNFKVSFPFNIELDYLAIEDEKGKWLEVENAKVAIQPLGLARKELSITTINASKVTVSHIPEFKVNKEKKADGDGFGLEIFLKEIHLPLIVLGTNITSLDKDLELSLQGNIVYSRTQKLSFDLDTHVLKDLSPFLKNIKITTKGYHDASIKSLNFEKAEINTGIFNIKGFTTINLANEVVDGKYNIECKELKKISEDLGGQAIDELIIQGSFKHLIVDGKLEAANLSYQNRNFPDLMIDHKFKYAVDQKMGTLAILACDDELKFNTDLIVGNDYIKLNQLKLLYKENQISSDISFNKKSNSLEGKVDISSNDLSTFSEVLDYNTRGEIKALINFTRSGDAQSVEIESETKDLVIDRIDLQTLNAKIFIKDLWQTRLGSANIKLESLIYNGQETLKVIDFKCEERNKTHDFTLTGEGRLAQKLNFTVKGNFEMNNHNSFVSNLRELDGKYGDYIIKSQTPIVINYGDNKVEYNAREIRIDKGSVSAQGKLRDHDISSKISFKQLPLFIQDMDVHKEFSDSKLDGEINLSGNPSMPIINSRLKISNISLMVNKSAKAQFNLNSMYRENMLEISSSITSMQQSSSDLKITLPVELSFKPYKLEVKKDEKIKGNLNLNIKVDPITALLLPPIYRFKGQLSANLAVSGNCGNPQITGGLSIEHGKFEHASTGIKIQNISSRLKALGRSIVIQELKASDNEGGDFIAGGKWDLNRKNMPFELALKANNFNFLNHPNIQATANGNLKISGDSSCASIKGDLEPTQVDIQLPESFAKDVPELNIIKTVFVPGAEEELSSENFFDKYKVSTDITLDAKRKIFVRGWGLDAELGGRLTCKGFIENPIIRGRLETIRGRYQELGKQFVLKRGRLNFEDSIPPSPYIDVIGSTVQDDTEIRIVLSGPVLKPNFSIESTPSMPQEEVLSTLLFGKQTTQISPFQALQLTDSLRRLSGHGGGSATILNKARGIFKVDDIKIKNDSSDPKDAALGVGKYLTDKVYLEIEKGTQGGSARTKVEIEIRNNLSIESSVGESGSSSVGINWRRDY